MRPCRGRDAEYYGSRIAGERSAASAVKYSVEPPKPSFGFFSVLLLFFRPVYKAAALRSLQRTVLRWVSMSCQKDEKSRPIHLAFYSNVPDQFNSLIKVLSLAQF